MGPNREIEILSANGELTATTKEGVTYILRFGNISGIADDDKGGEEGDASSADNGDVTGGVNRYLMVSTVVDESKFPVPELKPIPQTLEELDALDNPAPPADEPLPTELNPAEEPAPTTPEMKEGESEAEADPSATEDAAAPKEDDKKEEPAEEPPAEPDGEADSSEPAESADSDAADSGDTDAEPASGETDASGEGESTTVGEAQEEADEQASDESPAEGDEKSASESADSETAETTVPAEKPEPDSSDVEETEEEKLERLAAVQEKITKENERKLEERKENLQQARLTSQALNARFADWYYVIPEATYSKLRISREELFDASGQSSPNPAAMPPGMQNMQFPGFPGN